MSLANSGCLLLACWVMLSSAVLARTVGKRSDDSDPFKPVLEQLTAQVGQLQAQVQANKNTIDNLQQAVGFTVRTVQQDVHSLGLHQTIKFDHVLFNAGNGYTASTGSFTAPLAGTYVFYIQTLRHAQSEDKIYLDIMKNGSFLARVHAGYSPYENGSSMAVTHLQQGDEVHVQVSVGTSFTGGPYTTFAGFRISSQ